MCFMQQTVTALAVALRVLSAINEKRYPDPKDVDELRRWAPLSADVPIDELACEVIQQAINRRAQVRNVSA